MATKVYQLKNRSKASFYTKYCNVDVKLDFMHNMSDDGKAQIVVRDKFVQDAIEHDNRFNKEFELVSQFGAEDDNITKNLKTEVKDEAKAEIKKKKVSKQDESKSIVVDDVTSLNDAYDYFAAKGVMLDTLEDLKTKMDECKVEFPNLKI